MKTAIILATLTALVASVVAIPVEAAAAELSQRYAEPIPQADDPVDGNESDDAREGQSYFLKVCSNANFRGECNNSAAKGGKCKNLGNLLSDDVSSLDPENGFVCRIFRDSDCKGPSKGGIDHPVKNLRSVGFNDKMSAFRCHHK